MNKKAPLRFIENIDKMLSPESQIALARAIEEGGVDKYGLRKLIVELKVRDAQIKLKGTKLKMPKQNFVELDAADCTYLLALINEIDMDTPYTARQRQYTIPKLEQIAKEPASKRLAFQDVQYLLDLLEDDDLEETEQVRGMVQVKLEEIQKLQSEQARAMQDIETQRAWRRAKRQPQQTLQEHFQQTRG